ncbi:MAG: hypothetical protein GF331_00330 [Chitinivibrionales bacterium]|nr:hypothetical protein [Chitinivibrionales bacterium]
MANRSGHDENCVLILAPTGRDADVLAETLRDDGVTARVCATVDELCHCIRSGAGAAIIAGEALSEQALRALSDTLRQQPEWSDFPFTIMTSGDPDSFWAWTSLIDTIPEFNALLMERPVYKEALLAGLHMALRSRARQYQMRDELRRRREAEESLEAANRELDAFTDSVSHDLLNPLNTIEMMTAVLGDTCAPALDERGQRCIVEIVDARRKMTAIIGDLHRLSHVSRQQLVYEEVDLAVLSREIIEQLRRTTPARTVEATVDERMPARADPGLARIALENLISNAWKYTTARERASVAIGADTRDTERIFYVRDNGAGFDMRLADRLFQPFQRLHDPKQFTGTGIGLSIVKRIIERHGGRIWAESAVDKGATFFFTLPGKLAEETMEDGD